MYHVMYMYEKPSSPRRKTGTLAQRKASLQHTATCKINGNRSDGVPVVNWYKSAVEKSHLICKWK